MILDDSVIDFAHHMSMKRLQPHGKARVQSDPKIMMGKPVIAGTRITVEVLLERRAAGEIAEQIKEAYPHLPEGAIPAALVFAAEALKADVVYPLPLKIG